MSAVDPLREQVADALAAGDIPERLPGEFGVPELVLAAYLASEGATSLTRRLRSRLRPRKTRRRRVERTVQAIEALLDDGGRR